MSVTSSAPIFQFSTTLGFSVLVRAHGSMTALLNNLTVRSIIKNMKKPITISSRARISLLS